MSSNDQKKDSEQKNGNDRAPQVGALLRASRLRVGEDLRDVSDILCIRYLYLEAIEDCRYADLPGNTYAVGFIRSYAEHLGLDGDEVVRRYRLEQSGQKNATDLAFPTPVPDSGVPKGAIVFVGVLIALMVYGGWYVTTTDESILSDLISPVPDHLKHLVTGDDAQNGVAAPASGENVSSTDSAGSETSTAPAEVEKAVRDTTAAAGEGAEEAGKPAEQAVEAATETVSAAQDTAVETAQAESEQATDNAQGSVAEVTETVSENTSAVASDASMSAQTVTEPASEPAVTTMSEQTTSVTAETTEPGVTATTAEASAPETADPATAETSSAPGAATEMTQTEQTNVETASTQPTATETPAGDTASAMTETATTEASSGETASMTETASTDDAAAANSGGRELTAEDLNTLVLRQATGVAGQTSAPTPPETASVTSSDAVGDSGIVIRATSSSWVEIRNPENSDIIFTGLMNAGNVVNVPDIDGLTLDTGNAGALEISVDGVEVPKIGGIGAVRKDVALDAERLKAGTAARR